MTHNPEITQTPHNRNRSRGRTLATLAGVGLVGSIAAGVGLVYWTNNHNAEVAVSEATDMAKERNTCKLTKAEAVTKAGKTVIKATVTMQPGRRPTLQNNTYDGILGTSDVTFSDGDGNLQSGLRVLNKSHEESMNSVLLSSEKGSGMKAVSPDAASDGVTIGAPVLTADNSSYTVYRQNTIEVGVNGSLVDDEYQAVAGLVACGSFTYKMGSGVDPVIK